MFGMPLYSAVNAIHAAIAIKVNLFFRRMNVFVVRFMVKSFITNYKNKRLTFSLETIFEYNHNRTRSL
jgi:hypothetical protein